MISSSQVVNLGASRRRRKCENWLETYLKFTEASEAPSRFHFWSGVVAIAGALRRKVWLDMGLFEWTPNFFVFLVAPPGIVSKSTTAGLAMGLLGEVDGVTFGPSSVTWQALIERFEEVLMCWHPDGEDILGPGLDMSCLTIAASELGTFFNPQDREMVDVLVELWDGRRGRFERTTLGRGTKIAKNPWLNLIACTTPRWISEHLSAHFTGGGFSSRSVFVYAETKRRLVAYPFLEMGHREQQLRVDLLHDLRRMAELYGTFKLTSEALEYGSHLYEEHYKSPPAALATEQLLGYLARKQTHLHKLAMVLAAAESDSMMIEKRHLEKANESLIQIEVDMPKVFRCGRPEEISGLQDAVVQVMFNLKKVNRERLFRLFYHSIGIESFNKALDGALAAGYVSLQQGGTETWVEINPLIETQEQLLQMQREIGHAQ